MLNLDKIPPSTLSIAARVFDKLAQYCTLREKSERMRNSGLISEALHTERKLDDIYRELPRWAQWAGFERSHRQKRVGVTIK